MPSRYWSINPSSPLVSGLELAGSDLVNSSHEQEVSEVKKKLRFQTLPGSSKQVWFWVRKYKISR
jgi:hypothetical protein